MKKLFSIPRSKHASLLEIPSLLLCIIYLVLDTSHAQNTTNRSTDPAEANALISIFQKWGISASPRWNTTGDLCSGSAVDNSSFNDPSINPAIKCICTYNNGSTCRITQLKVHGLDATGNIPEELGHLTKLFDLNLLRNQLTGPLPAFMGNLTDMRWLSLGTNLLTGTIPKELGNLWNLLSLSLSTNNFSGQLPPELGNLRNLGELYIDSSGIRGPIPSTFANLQFMRIMYASNCELTGKIPDFLGNWRNLESLRLEGTSFEGPIPSSFSSLTKLTDLRLSDLSNGNVSLEFIKDLKSLSTLKLRNNRISGTIPSNIVKLSLLQELFLGNNSLSGTLPSVKSTSLLNIDLSYNQFSGSFPTWVTQPNLQLNLVANNFTFDNNNGNNLPSGLNCLQRNFPCFRGSPTYSSFAVKCGGPQVRSTSGLEYESENENLHAASYFVTKTRRWAVSNVGLFSGDSNASYTTNSRTPISNTLDAQLFQSSRVSPSSLRYYGLGLENGRYNISLLFAETIIKSAGTGRRVFDIYIQGNLATKNFDLKGEAGGASYRAVEKKFQAQVSENFLEIHLFWAGKGTVTVPKSGTYGPSIAAIRVTPDFTPTVSNRPPSTSSKKTGLVVGVSVGVGVLLCTLLLALFLLWRRRLRTKEDAEVLGMGADTFTYAELKNATNDFNPMNKLGEGGFGAVYKGTLADRRVVAVKQLSFSSHQGKPQFVAEVATISSVQHRNLVRLFGCCTEGDKRLLVYEYLENKSLDQALFTKNSLFLCWSTRYNICIGTARGLSYLHEESRLRIIHRDVKASNILLNGDLNPKISDFGLARLIDDTKTHVSTKVVGTIGYLAPEYAMLGHLTEKADVFGYGVVALEIISGRPNSDPSLEVEKMYLLEWAWHLNENGRLLDLVDPTLTEFDEAEALRVIRLAFMCTQASPFLRPPMSRVVAMLQGDMEVNIITSKPGYLSDWPYNDVSGCLSSGTLGLSTQVTTETKHGILSNGGR